MEDFDIEELARMFDAALASDNPSVKKALRNFMMIAAIVQSEENNNEITAGPFEKMFKRIASLERNVRELQNSQTYISNISCGDTWRGSVGYSATEVNEIMKDLKFK